MEFVPLHKDNFDLSGAVKPDASILTIDQVEENKEYALLISTCAGAWRYLIGDTLKFTDKNRCEIVITGRTKHFLSICGEHLSVDNMNQAISRCSELLDIEVKEFTVCGVKSGSHFAHRWYVGSHTTKDAALFASTLDEQLKLLNDDYAAERSAMLRDIQLEVVPPGVFYEWQKANGKMNGQSKFPRVMNEEQFTSWEQFVDRKV